MRTTVLQKLRARVRDAKSGNYGGLRGLKPLARCVLRLAAPSHLKEVVGIDGWLSWEEASLLYRLAREVDDGCIVEIGSYRGRSATALAIGASKGHQATIYALDPHDDFIGAAGARFGPEDRGQFYRTMLRTSCYRSVHLINLSSEIVCPGWKHPVGLLWIDGNHTYDAVKNDFQCWEPHLTKKACVVFDDVSDPALGPARVIKELTLDGGFEIFENLDKVVALRRH